MSNEFILIQKLEFHDRYEDEVLHVGTLDQCKVRQDLIPETIYTCTDVNIISARSVIQKVAAGEFKKGARMTENKH